jgi:hypothetical protein
MLSIPLVNLLGLLAYLLVRYGKQKVSGMVVGVLFGLALASTALGPPILRGVNVLSASLVGAISSAVAR